MIDTHNFGICSIAVVAVLPFRSLACAFLKLLEGFEAVLGRGLFKEAKNLLIILEDFL